MNEPEFSQMREARLPFALGVAGLVPFWGLAVAHVLRWPGALDPSLTSLALAAYAATILSFLGGIRWGIAVVANDQRRVTGDYVVAVVPQLFGWACLILADPWRLLALAMVILVLGPLDRRMVGRGLAPHWFGRLRMILSLGAGAALLVAAF